MVHDVLRGRERLVMHPDDLLARLRAPTAHAFERRTVGEQAPESIVKPEGWLDDELSQVMREVPPGGHRGPPNAPALRASKTLG